MAYMSQEKKKEIQAELKKIIPLDWKWSLSVHNHSTLQLTIRQAPVDLIGLRIPTPHHLKNKWNDKEEKRPEYMGLNYCYLENTYDGELLRLFERIKGAMMTGNHDNSDIQSDYFDVGWYIDISIGRWSKPFVCTGEIVEKVAA